MSHPYDPEGWDHWSRAMSNNVKFLRKDVTFVSEVRSPTVRRRELGALLRKLRTEKGLTVEQAAEQLMFSMSKLSRMETGHGVATPRDIRDVCSLYEVTDEAERERMKAEAVRHQQNEATLRQMFEVWITDGVQRADSNAELRRTFEKDILASLGDRPVRTINDSDLRDALRKVGRNRKRGRTAERMLSELRQMFRWSIKRQPWKALLPDGNPAELVEAKQVVPGGYEPVVRDRVLDASRRPSSQRAKLVTLRYRSFRHGGLSR